MRIICQLKTKDINYELANISLKSFVVKGVDGFTIIADGKYKNHASALQSS